ncbi:MAG TPA: hypothetical protein VFU14_15555 [Acidimicrobiales bacterium]|nr:hypothetical protein [Acidimicrobiales bacterium]
MPAIRADRSKPRLGGRTRVVSTSPAGTELEVGDTLDRIAVAALPDPVHAGRVARTLDRVLWQRLEVSGSGATGVVVGTRHRRPVHLRVAGSVALGLLEAGVPTVTRRVEAAR